MRQKQERDRCDHCKKWVTYGAGGNGNLCGTLESIVSPGIEIDFAICNRCFNSHSPDDRAYWDAWAKKQEREDRSMVADKKAVGKSTYVFLFVVKSPCGDLHEIAKTTPKDTDLSDGDLLYYWEVKGRYAEPAINRAIQRCQWLRARTDLDWKFDGEFTVTLVNDSKITESFSQAVSNKLQALGLW